MSLSDTEPEHIWVVQRKSDGTVIRKAGPFAKNSSDHRTKFIEYMHIAQAHNQGRQLGSLSRLHTWVEDQDPGESVAESNGFQG